MKRFILFLSLLLLIPFTAFGQDPTVPTTWGEVITNFNVWFGTLAGIAAVTVFVAGFFNTLLGIGKKIWRQIVSWIVAVILVFAGSIFNIGFIADFPWLTTLVYGLAAGLVANGMFDINIVKAILEFLNLKKIGK